MPKNLKTKNEHEYLTENGIVDKALERISNAKENYKKKGYDWKKLAID